MTVGEAIWMVTIVLGPVLLALAAFWGVRHRKPVRSYLDVPMPPPVIPYDAMVPDGAGSID